MEIKGRLEFVDIGVGFWKLVTKDKSYRLVLQNKITMPATPCEIKIEASEITPDTYFADQDNSQPLYVTSLTLV